MYRPIARVAGEFELILRNAETLEIEDVIKSKNVFNSEGSYKLITNISFIPDEEIRLTEQDIYENYSIKGADTLRNINDADQSVTSATVLVQPIYFDTVDPPYIYREERFGQPATTKNWRVIMYGEVAYTRLDVVCTQTPTQVLDVVYRLYLIYPQQSTLYSNNNVSISPIAHEWQLKYAFATSTRKEVGGSTRKDRGFILFPVGSQSILFYAFNKIPPIEHSPYNFFMWIGNSGLGSDNIIDNYTHDGSITSSTFPMEARYSWVSSQNHQTIQTRNVGRILGSASFGYGDRSVTIEEDLSWDPDTTELHVKKLWNMVPALQRIRDLSNTVINNPVQPIHNHDSTAFTPFIDVDHLANRAGYPSANGAAWTDPDYPKFYRIDYNTTGNVSVSSATYTFRVRDTLGFFDQMTPDTPRLGTYVPWSEGDPYIFRGVDDGTKIRWDATALALTSSVPPTGNIYSSIPYGHHGRVERMEEYDYMHTIWVDDDGITLMNNLDHKYYNFDQYSTPSMPTVDIRQVSASSNGEIWVGDGTLGIYRITDPTANATVTKQTTGLPSAGETPCYGVATHSDGTIFAMTGGGLYKSTGNGTWTATSFAFSGSGANTASGNWAATLALVLDPEHVNHQMLITTNTAITTTPANRRETWWWDEVDYPSGTLGPINFQNWTDLGTRVIYNKSVDIPIATRVSKVGGFWVSSDSSYHTQVGGGFERAATLYRLTFGSRDRFAIDNEYENETTKAITEWKNLDRIPFIYDNYNVPYVLGNGPSGSTRRGLWSIDGEWVGGGWTIENLWQPFDIEHISLYPEGVTPSGKRGNGIFFKNSSSPSGSYTGNQRFVCQLGAGPISMGTPEFDESVWYTGTPDADKALMSLNMPNTPFQEALWRDYRWNGSTWELNYCNTAISSGNSASASPINASRHGFDVESTTFNGRALINATAVFVDTSYNGNVQPFSSEMTFTAYVKNNWGVKNNAILTSGPDFAVETGRGPYYQEPKEVLFEYNDSFGNNRIKLFWNNSNNKIELIEKTTRTEFYPTPTSNARVVFTANTTEYALYIDGSLANTIAPNSAVSFNNSQNNAIFTIGASNYNTEYNNRNRPYNFMVGELENIQIWSRTLSSSEVTEDWNNIATTGLPTSNVGLEARYTVEDQTLSESKAVHSSYETLHDGITIKFQDGTDGLLGFQATDYHTFAVVSNGLMIDNSMKFDWKLEDYYYPTNINFTAVTAANGDTNVPSSGISVTGEKVMWSRASDNGTLAADPLTNAQGFGTGFGLQHSPGTFSKGGGAGSGYSETTTSGLLSVQQLIGDFTIKATVSKTQTRSAANGDNGFGITATWHTDGRSNGGFSEAAMSHRIVFNNDGFADLYENGTLISSNWQSYSPGDEFYISRSGSTVTYGKTSGSSTVSGLTNGSNVYVVAVSRYHEFGMHNVTIDYTKPAGVMSVGSASPTANGIHDPYYLTCGWSEFATKVYLDGNEIEVNVELGGYGQLTAPAANTCTFEPEAGMLIFNSADYGKAVTGIFTVITR